MSFQNNETFLIPEKEVETKLAGNTIMGTREYSWEKAEKQGLEKGKLEERKKVEAEKLVEAPFTKRRQQE